MVFIPQWLRVLNRGRIFSEKDDNTNLPNSGVNSASPSIDNQATSTMNEPSKDTDNPQATKDRPILFKLNRNGGEIPKEEHQKMHGRGNKEVTLTIKLIHSFVKHHQPKSHPGQGNGSQLPSPESD